MHVRINLNMSTQAILKAVRKFKSKRVRLRLLRRISKAITAEIRRFYRLNEGLGLVHIHKWERGRLV